MGRSSISTSHIMVITSFNPMTHKDGGNLKGPVSYILYVCRITQCCFTHLQLCFKKTDFLLWTILKKDFLFVSQFHRLIYCIFYQNVLSIRRSVQPYITCHALFQFICWWKTSRETVWRGLLTLKSCMFTFTSAAMWLFYTVWRVMHWIWIILQLKQCQDYIGLHR